MISDFTPASLKSSLELEISLLTIQIDGLQRTQTLDSFSQNHRTFVRGLVTAIIKSTILFFLKSHLLGYFQGEGPERVESLESFTQILKSFVCDAFTTSTSIKLAILFSHKNHLLAKVQAEGLQRAECLDRFT